jgi:hypothetical protein
VTQVLKWFLAVVPALVALGAVLIPFLVIQPFKAQDEQQLLLVLGFKPWVPVVGVLCVIFSLLQSRRIRRWPAYVLSVLTVVFAGLGFVNVFEIMFHRIDEAKFAVAADAKVDGDDMLLTVKLGGESRAYPVRMLAYHHLVNDRVAGVPIVATY